MSENEKTYWGWRDIADLPEAIIFYGEMVSRGYHHHEIKRMLDDYFPKIDGATCKVIRFRAFKWLKSLATDIEPKIYMAKSMVRLERICANEHEKTKNVLVADSQLTHLLGLANIQEKDGPEELAAKMRAFLLGAQAATDGTAYAKKEKDAETTETENKNENKNETTEEQKQEQKPEQKPEQEQKSPINSGDKTVDEVIKTQAPKLTPEMVQQEKEDEEAIDLLLRVSRAHRLKENISELEKEGIKDVNNKDEWDSEDEA